MGAIDQIINISILLQTQAVPQPSFSIPLIVGPSNRFGDLVRYYTSTAAALADGFMTSDPEYIRLAEALSQALVPTQVGIGKNTAAVAQIDTIAVNSLTGVPGHVYSFTLNTIVISYTSLGGNVQQDILNGLNAAIGVAFPSNPPVNGVVTGTGSGALLTLTSTVAGQGVAYGAVDSELTHLNPTPNHSIATDIASIQAVSDIWYGLTISSQADADIEQVAAYIESQRKIFVADSNSAGILTSSNTDVASVLKGKAYNRTALMYAGTVNDGRAAAWLGGQLPQVPGASTWKFKQLVGITPDVLTPTQRLNAIGTSTVPGKNANIYEVVGGQPITEEGFMASGRFIDITVGIDWFESTLQANVYQLLVSNPKIPYTNAGAAIVENAIRQTIKQGISNGLIDGASAFEVSVADVNTVSANTRAQRISPPFNFSFRLAGAFHFVVINGVVTS